MRTSNSIEQQEERKKARNNGSEPRFSPQLTQPVTQKRGRGDASRIAAWRWQKGVSANPGGVPKHDISKEICQAIFSNTTDLIYKAGCKMLAKGNAYAFQGYSDRAFGKLRETHQLDVGQFGERSMTEEELENHLKELKDQSGMTALEEENAELKNELGELKQRFAELERRIGVTNPPAVRPAPAAVKPM